MTPQTETGGAGPLYEHTEAGQQAAAEEVIIPGSDDKASSDGGSDPETHATGDDQARINQEDEPPA